jgi:hypothetical protein
MTEDSRGMTFLRNAVFSLACTAVCAVPVYAQSRGVYPLGMSAVNSGLTPDPGFSYGNQLLFYSRDSAKDDDGNALPVMGHNGVLMDLNSFIWVSDKEILGGARYSASATLPVAKNELESDVTGPISGGSGYADSYFLPLILGWNAERTGIRFLVGFLAPTGRFSAGASNNVGSGYWTLTLSSGQTVYLTENKLLVFSAFEMYEWHTTQEGTEIHPGETLDVDYSLMRTFSFSQGSWRLQAGVVGYEQRQTTAKTGPSVTEVQSSERYAVNAIGVGLNATVPQQELNVSLRLFKEFENRATFQGYSVQLSGAIRF